jgi:hypothetical protein
MIVTSIDELEDSLTDILGDGFVIEQDRNGQLIIFTGLRQDDDGELTEYLDDEDLEEDLESDPDTEALIPDDED